MVAKKVTKENIDNALTKHAQNLFKKNFDLLSTEAKFKDNLEEFSKPTSEDQIVVGQRSWCPEDDSHNSFKHLIVESFTDKRFKTLTHVSHDLARKCIEWFGTPGGKIYTVIILILR